MGAGCTTTIGGNDESPVNVEVNNELIEEIAMEVTTYTHPGVLGSEEIGGKKVKLTTDKGEIVFELFNETAPLAVSNFVYLAGEGYYDGLTFHRREEGFVIQGGDPNGTGTGGPGYKFEDELSDEYTYERGIVAMANAGPNTNGSQFFIMLADVPLPKSYTIFGRVTEGLEVVDKIVIGDKMNTVVVESAEAEEEPAVQDEPEAVAEDAVEEDKE